MQIRPSHFTLNASSPLATGLLFAGLQPSGLVGSTYHQDSSPRNNHATLTNIEPATDCVWAPEIGRWCVSLGGSNQTIVIPSGVMAAIGGGLTMSMCGWFRPAAFTSYNAFIDSSYLGASRNLSLFVNTGSSGWVAFGNSGGTGATFNPAFTTGEWQHIVFQCNSTTLVIYRNGVQNSSTGSIGLGLSTTDVIHCGENITGGGSDYSGKVADLMIWNRTLNSSEIQQLADPSNVMLSGLINYPKRQWWPVAAAGGSTTLVVPNSQCVVTSPTIDLVQHHALTVPASDVVVTSPDVALIQHHVLTVPGSSILITSPTITWMAATYNPMQFMVC
jgi:hypothetical protein